jgi:hypothetical protein
MLVLFKNSKLIRLLKFEATHYCCICAIKLAAQYIFFNSTYTRVSNFRQNLTPKLLIPLIRRSTYTRVYTLVDEILVFLTLCKCRIGMLRLGNVSYDNFYIKYVELFWLGSMKKGFVNILGFIG